MREGLGAFHRAAFWCSVLALAIAAPAIAEESGDSEESGIRRWLTFEESDTDGDGRLSKEERAAARERHYQQHLEEFDADGDGKLSDTEKDAARKQRYSRHIEQFDTDGDGTLSEEERDAAREKRSGRQDRALERFDADGDGELTGDEKKKAMDARKRHRDRQGRGPGDRPAVDQPGNAPQAP